MGFQLFRIALIGLFLFFVCLIVLKPVAVFALDLPSSLRNVLKNFLFMVLRATLSEAISPIARLDIPINSGTSPNKALCAALAFSAGTVDLSLYPFPYFKIGVTSAGDESSNHCRIVVSQSDGAQGDVSIGGVGADPS